MNDAPSKRPRREADGDTEVINIRMAIRKVSKGRGGSDLSKSFGASSGAPTQGKKGRM